jgi:hypothetical protein
VTDEERSRRPIFNAILRAVASWLFFRVAHSLRIDSDMLVVRALKNNQLTGGATMVYVIQCTKIQQHVTGINTGGLTKPHAGNRQGLS